MNEVETRELRYFVAVAEELNFSHAAICLGIAQPPLSRAIRKLEDKLGIQLLKRNTREVILTAAGQEFLVHARVAIEAVSMACRRARQVGAPSPQLRLAVKPGSDTALINDIVTAYEADATLPRVETIASRWDGPLALVRDGRADVALLRTPFNDRGLDVEPLLTEPRVAALPASHPLARRRVLGRVDLADEAVPRWSNVMDERAVAYWSGLDRPGGTENGRVLRATPPPGPVVDDIVQLLDVVALGKAVAFLPVSVRNRFPRSDVVYRPVMDLSPSVTALAWPESCRSAAMAAFVRAAVETAWARCELLAAHR